jgi:hypothetical protein
MKEESHDLQKTGIPPATGFAPVTHNPRLMAFCHDLPAIV